jgi:hypothetical protein
MNLEMPYKHRFRPYWPNASRRGNTQFFSIFQQKCTQKLLSLHFTCSWLLVVDLMRSKCMAGMAVLFVVLPGTGKTALTMAIAQD